MNLQTCGSWEAGGNPVYGIERGMLAPLFRFSMFWTPEREAPSVWVEHVPFAFWIVDVLRPRRIVELGTHNGVSYSAMCQAVKRLGLATSCYAIDNWQEDPHAGFYGEEVYRDLAAFHDQRYGAFSQLVRSTFDEALHGFEDGSIDLLHIDGLHTYDAVRHDYESWLPKLAANAVVLFHDASVRERDFGIFQFWSEITADRLHFSFAHGHGLGVLGLGRDYPDGLRVLFGANENSRLVSTIRETFEALGRSVRLLSERQRLSRSLSEQTTELSRLRATLAARENELKSLRQWFAQELDAVGSELRALGETVVEMRRSMSWRLTAPLRLLGRFARGDLAGAVRTLKAFGAYASAKLLHTIRVRKLRQKSCVPLIDARCALTKQRLNNDPIIPLTSKVLPAIDISVVTYNSQRWIKAFVDSVLALDYPRHLLAIRFVDNESSDATLVDLQLASVKLQTCGLSTEVFSRPNHGFGAGHNAAIAEGRAPFCLVTNIDLTFEPESLKRVAVIAAADDERVAAWELRQKPYEHPKFYDPITGATNWNSHACVLLRRSALAKVGGYDETLFMYGEDVELSFRLRSAGAILRYCPKAAVNHFSYEHANEVKPLQYIGNTFANLYLRLKYGTLLDIAKIPSLAVHLLLRPQVFPGSRRAVIGSLFKLMTVLPRALAARHRSNAVFQFLGWDYELARNGAFVSFSCTSSDQPLVSVITRTYAGREIFLRQALLSVAHQTYPNVEHIVVEDGGDTMREVVGNIKEVTGSSIRFFPSEKGGRSKVGNAGLAVARGRWCLFLDDDDLLFADHVETLVNALLENSHVVGAYSLAWEVVTDDADIAVGSYRELTYHVPDVFFQDFDTLIRFNYIPIQSLLFERRLFEERGGFGEDLDALEDWNLWMRYAYGNKFLYVARVTSFFRTPACIEKREKRNKIFEIYYPIIRARAKSYRANSMFQP